MWNRGSPERGQSQLPSPNPAPIQPQPRPTPPASPPPSPVEVSSSTPTSPETSAPADTTPKPTSVPPTPNKPPPPPPSAPVAPSNPAPNNPTTAPVTDPSPNAAGVCPQIRVRREWRNMERDVQKSYISAVKCLLTKPSRLQPGSSRRLYDDFVFVHDRSRNSVHWVSAFLPWHRHFIYLQEKALIECGYSGSLPRWDWTLDSDNFTKAPVWSPDPETGFGTNGAENTADPNGLGGGSVIDGAFANLQLRYPDQHVLERGFTSPAKFNEGGKTYGSQYYDDTAIKVVQSSQDFLNFRVAIEGTNPSSRGVSLPGPHGTIHMIIGGDMSPSSYAPNDPYAKIFLYGAWRPSTKTIIFFLHHGNVDYHWSTWQDASPEARLKDYSGNTVQGRNVNNAKITDMLRFLNLGADLPVQKVMDTRAFPYCYEYE
ncbi:hypothetical protein PTTG_03515 [Puccinia triticina 1-1 BBBD Race 1]|uniref:Tyrosinase_Cu-bd domain-containing protein n=1 Tax=Puccinia triticina (isolate 1-1 / race 1 (BBBD)) TaxID=630390 RepID=A0A180GX38_PUCT1|nr:hypothetical protein PTTG_03515 [Puccinia triticina 1-1 BBBD Race 1]